MDCAPSERTIKMVVVGDAFVGKTSLLYSYTQNQFPQNYLCTVYENFTVSVVIDARKVTLNLFDTAGQEDYATLRALSYPHTDVFLLCFSLVDPKSLDNCQSVWMPDIRAHADDGVPVVLVGTKADLRDQQQQAIVSADQGAIIAHRIGAVKYIECSALTKRGLKQAFDMGILAALGRLDESRTTTTPDNNKSGILSKYCCCS